VRKRGYDRSIDSGRRCRRARGLRRRRPPAAPGLEERRNRQIRKRQHRSRWLQLWVSTEESKADTN
jgi:hypothetical protein